MNNQHYENISLEKIEISMNETYHLYDGKPIYEKKFDSVMSYHQPGVAAVKNKSGAYHIDLEGNSIYQKRFFKTFGFYDGLAAVVDNSGWYHIDLEGHSQYNERYEWVGNFQEDRCTVRDQDGYFFHIKMDGTKAYSEKYKYAGDYKYSIAVVYDLDGFAKHIDKTGNYIHDKKLRELGVFHKGYATAKDKRGAFHINKKGNPLYKSRYRWVEPFYNGYAFVCKHNGEKLVINEQGDIIHEIYNQNSPIIQNTLRKNLMGMLVSYWKSQIIHSIVKLHIFEMIKAGYNTFDKLLEKTQLPIDSLKMIIQVLKIWDFIEVTLGIYELQYLGNMLTEDHPKSLKYAALMWGEEHYLAMSKLTEALQYYKPQFNNIFGQPIFEYFNSNKERGFIFDKAMEAYTLDYNKIIKLYDFSETRVILDIGGGTGHLLEKILLQNNDIKKGIIFDLPSVIENAKKTSPESIKDKIEYISGDLFEKIPLKADTIIVSRVLHDWNDDNALKILSNIHDTLNQSGKLLIFEMIIPEDPEYDIGVTLNFNLLVNVGGKERSLEEFKIILQKTGFEVVSVKNNEGIISLIIVKKQGVENK